MDYDSFVLSIRTQDINNYLKSLKEFFDFSNLDENHELFSNKNENIFANSKMETPNNNLIDEFVRLACKSYSFQCNDKLTNTVKGVSKSYSKHFKNEYFRKCLVGEDYQKECDNYILRSPNNKMCLQLVKNSTLTIFDDKRCDESNSERKPWECYNFMIPNKLKKCTCKLFSQCYVHIKNLHVFYVFERK